MAGPAFAPHRPGAPAWDDDKLHEECGVFGVMGVDNAAATIALGLHALQHRGQEGCGMAAFNGETFAHERHLGLVGEHFSGKNLTARLPGDNGIGHVRYSTSGDTSVRNSQPLYADLRSGGFAVAHNGNITNARVLRERLVAEGKIFQSTSDTEVILHLIASSRGHNTVERFIDALRQIEGGYALVAMTNKKLIGARDPYGIRPLVLGYLGDAPILASETCAIEMVGGRVERDINPGEVLVCTEDGVRSIEAFPRRTPRTCAFEYIYFARPDSEIDGVSVYRARKNMGRRLAEETPADVDVIVPVPDSGVPAALGYAEASGVPFELGIIRSHFIGRTFIQPSQDIRDLGVRMKHRANISVIAGKRVLLVDDSIVRGTTSRKIVAMVREAGATEVHFRSASPQIKYPDFYGIDMPEREELLAARKPSLAQMAAELDADSLGFLSVDGLYRAILGAARDPDAPQLTDHYFTGDYPTRLIDLERGMADKERQLSFLETI